MGFGFDDIIQPVIGGVFDYYNDEQNRDAQDRANRQNYEMQKEFAQHGIRWRVDDARAAGLHPLAAVGASPASASPSYTAFQSDLLSNMGQNINRAINATRTQRERDEEMHRLQIEGARLDNQYKQVLIKNAQVTNPPFPSNDLGINLPGQSSSSSSMIEQIPVPRTASTPGRPYQDFGHVADYGYARTPYGLSIIPSRDIKERIEDQIIPETAWSIRNNLLPNFSKNFPTPKTKDYPLPKHMRDKGYKSWRWSFTMQQFVPSRLPEGETTFIQRWKDRLFDR